MELKEKKKKLNRIRLVVALAVLFTCISVGSRIGSGVVTGQAYRDLVEISPATQVELRREAYLQAIRLSPEEPVAYIRLIDCYNEDGIFEKTESQEFLAIYNSYHTQLNFKDSKCSQIFYKAGLFFVNGYEGNMTTRLRMALPFLETARDLMTEEDPGYMAVTCYCEIGRFYQDYIWDAASAVREVSPSEMEALMNRILVTQEAFKTDTSSDAIYNRLGFSLAAGNLLFDQRDILAATISQDLAQTVIDTIYADLPQMETLQKEQTRALLQALLDNRQTYTDMIDRAYGRANG